MKKYVLVLSAIVVLVLASCQKEIDWGLGGSNEQMLVMVFSKTGPDSTVINYSYDSQKRLISEVTVGVGSGVTLDMTFQVNRNSSGIITTTVQKSAALLAAGIDSIITRYIYNTSSSRYTSASFDITIGGFTVTDSAVYTYDGSGRIISDLHYLVTGLVPPFEAIKNQYTYSANGQNLVSIDVLGAANPGDPLTLISSQAFTFDAKSDALILKNEAIILGRHGFYNANNATKVDFTSPVDPSQNFTLDYTYKYNSTNRPDSSYATRTPGGAVTASKYFYQ